MQLLDYLDWDEDEMLETISGNWPADWDQSFINFAASALSP